jgi:hypothetical protein
MGVQTTEARGGDGKQRCVVVREVFEENDKLFEWKHQLPIVMSVSILSA